MCDMTHSLLIYMCDMTHSLLFHMCDMTHSLLMSMRDMIHSPLIHLCDMTRLVLNESSASHSFVWHDSFLLCVVCPLSPEGGSSVVLEAHSNV